MKMRMAEKGVAVALVLALLACGAGCGRGPSNAEVEKSERTSRLYANAMDDFEAGRMDSAIKGFERVVLHEPEQYAAHFQLATLLQDIRKDYIGAIAHYRTYLALRPSDDTATVALDRAKLCETLLRAEMLRQAGGNVANKLTAENEKIAAEKKALAAQVVALENDLAAARKQVERFTRENEKYRTMLSKFSEEKGGGPAKSLSAKEALAELRALEAEEKRRRVRPTDAELLDDDAPGPSGTLGQSPLVKRLRAEAEREERAEVNRPQTQKPNSAKKGGVAPGSGPLGVGFFGKSPKKADKAARPDTYTVQEGDTLFKISTRFYGSNAKWRAIQQFNRATVPMNGRLRPGQVLKLP